VEMLQAYRAVAADHVYQLLGDVPLGEKAEQMSERLYNSISISEDAGRRGRPDCKSAWGPDADRAP
jgi:hypothetical protein